MKSFRLVKKYPDGLLMEVYIDEEAQHDYLFFPSVTDIINYVTEELDENVMVVFD